MQILLSKYAHDLIPLAAFRLESTIQESHIHTVDFSPVRTKGFTSTFIKLTAGGTTVFPERYNLDTLKVRVNHLGEYIPSSYPNFHQVKFYEVVIAQ